MESYAPFAELKEAGEMKTGIKSEKLRLFVVASEVFFFMGFGWFLFLLYGFSGFLYSIFFSFNSLLCTCFFIKCVLMLFIAV